MLLSNFTLQFPVVVTEQSSPSDVYTAQKLQNQQKFRDKSEQRILHDNGRMNKTITDSLDRFGFVLHIKNKHHISACSTH